MEQKEGLNINIPTAIVIAGLFIAGAIAFTRTPNINITSTSGFKTIAEEVGLNKNLFQACLSGGEFKDRVEADYRDGLSIGITGTPTTVIMNKTGQKKLLVGALGEDGVKAEIANLSGSAEKINLAPISNEGHFYGNPDAEIVMVEYSDTECPFCKRFQPTLKKIVDESRGKVAWVYRHFPIDQLHSKARKEAEATECAGKLGGNDKFWEYLDRLFEVTPSNDGLDPARL